MEGREIAFHPTRRVYNWYTRFEGIIETSENQLHEYIGNKRLGNERVNYKEKLFRTFLRGTSTTQKKEM